jgi:hypothetical protein
MYSRVKHIQIKPIHSNLMGLMKSPQMMHGVGVLVVHLIILPVPVSSLFASCSVS